MKHKSQVNPDNTLELNIVGNISAPDVSGIKENLTNFTDDLKKKGHKAKLLANYTHAGKHGHHHHNLLNTILDFNFHKFAAYSLDRFTANAIMSFVKLKNAQDKIRLFRTRDEAELWLTEK